MDSKAKEKVMGSNNKHPFNTTIIKNNMIIIRRKDGTIKQAYDRKTGDAVKVDKYGNRV
jgi:hypothetical protein